MSLTVSFTVDVSLSRWPTQAGCETLLPSLSLGAGFSVHILEGTMTHMFFLLCPVNFDPSAYVFFYPTYISLPTIYWWCMWVQKGITVFRRIIILPDGFILSCWNLQVFTGISIIYFSSIYTTVSFCSLCVYSSFLALCLYLIDCILLHTESAAFVPWHWGRDLKIKHRNSGTS